MSEKAWRKDHRDAVEKSQADTDEVMKDLAGMMEIAIGGGGGYDPEAPLTEEARIAIMRQVDIALDSTYPISQRDQESRLGETVVRGANLARIRVIRRSVSPLFRKIEKDHPDLAEAMTNAANRRRG